MGVVRLSNGVQVINCTPHELVFEDGTIVHPSGYLLQAKMQEKQLSEFIYEVTVLPTEEGEKELQEIEEKYGKDVIILGSSISAQAYPRKVKMISLTKNRAKVTDKVCRIDKFSVYPDRR
ncbi:MAG: hypothetical protein B5M53_12165 [Candidatus Cloacimonas sp. 4484_209]|nr:MAG: hypothetical protein B5M53_12165 [Candidatus Cloacimonas sp. 4484_209]